MKGERVGGEPNQLGESVWNILGEDSQHNLTPEQLDFFLKGAANLLSLEKITGKDDFRDAAAEVLYGDPTHVDRLREEAAKKQYEKPTMDTIKRMTENPSEKETGDVLALSKWLASPESKNSPIEQLKAMPTLYEMSRRALPDGETGEATLKNIRQAISKTATDKGNSPLVRMMAQELDRSTVDNVVEHILYGLSGRTVGSEFMNYTPQKDFNLAQLHTKIENSNRKIDEDTVFLLETAHNPKIEPLINRSLDLNLSDIPLDAQAQLLKFMTEAGDTRFDSLCSTLHKVEPELRLKLAEGFLAADFGEDFGDALLDIANSEQISGEQLGEILDQIGSCRESIAGITRLYAPIYNGDFAKEYARAANERLTDVITVFKKIATEGDGRAKAKLRWGRDNEEDQSLGYGEAIEALKYEATSLSIISGVLKDVLDRKKGCFAERLISPDESKGTAHLYSFYALYSPNYGFVSLHTRAEGSSVFDRGIEYGGAGTEASISFMTNPVEPFEVPAVDKDILRNKNRVSALRLDREGRSPDWEAGDPRMNPILDTIEMLDESGEVKTIKVGTISVDLAAIGDAADTPSGKIARLVSVGNQIRNEEKENGEANGGSLNHNINGFDHAKYGTAEGFKGIVQYLDNLMMVLCEESPPARGQSAREREIAKQLHEIEQRVAGGEVTREDLQRQKVLEAAGRKIKRERGRQALNKFGRVA